MLREITLKNFKPFNELNSLNIKPITVLCGTNSSGKSSVLQSILLIKQTLESRNLTQTLRFNGRFTDLGSFENTVFQKKKDREMSFDFSFQIRTEYMTKNVYKGIIQIPWRDFFKEMLSQKAYFDKDTEYRIRAEVSLKAGREEEISLKPIIVSKFNFGFEAIFQNEDIRPLISFEIIHATQDYYVIKWKKLWYEVVEKEDKKEEVLRDAGDQFTAKIDFANIFPLSIDVDETERHDTHSLDTIIPFRINEIIEKIFDSYSYIGPLREKPSRIYICEDKNLEIGAKGENAAFIYSAEQHTNLDEHYFYDKNTDAFIPEKRLTLGAAVQEWLTIMGINKFKAESANQFIFLDLDSSVSNKTRVSIADVGFGVSQIFPIILEGLRMPRGYTLILEQPEIHLHPNLQMQMADYFIALALSGKNVIAETHSDHVVNRLVRRIVEDESGQLQELIGIYFLKPSENGSIAEEIQIDETQGIINWPEDFFDQTATEQEKIMRAGLKKRKKLREQKKESFQ